MKVIYLKNYRKGAATNSSSTHSIIYKNKDEMFNDLNVMSMNFYGRFTETIAASKEAKIKYIAASVWNKKILEYLCAFYPEMKQYMELIEEQERAEEQGFYDADIFGTYGRGELTFDTSESIEASVDYLRYIIEDEEAIIVGGSDEADFVYDTIKDHDELPVAWRINDDIKPVKNGNYWVAYSYWNENRLRFKTEKGDCVPLYPELIDLKITDQCENGCPFCYMNASPKGAHADWYTLQTTLGTINGYKDFYNKRVEFSIGGGNILLYPHLKDLLVWIKGHGHIANTTLKAIDFKKACLDDDINKMFMEYVNGIGISVSDDKDLEIVTGLGSGYFVGEKKHVYLTIHLIPEMLGVKKTREYVEKLRKAGFYNFLFLGYKDIGRGANCEYKTFTKLEFMKLIDQLYNISIDTTFAKRYKEWINNNFDTQFTVTWDEGEYSMYIDAVTNVAYRSSYDLDKAYPLRAPDNLTGRERQRWNETYGSPYNNIINAFSKIRQDGGFKIFKQ